MYYITYKNLGKVYETIPNHVTSVVDKLFAGEEVDEHINYNVSVKSVRTITKAFTSHNQIKYSRKYPYSVVQLYDKLDELVHKYPLESRHTQYTTFKIPKRSGGLRDICAPLDEFKEDLRQVVHLINSGLHILPHDSAWAYVPGRDVVGAMQEHTKNGSRWYLKLDFKNFFGSCTPEFVSAQLLKLYPLCDGVLIPQSAQRIANNIANISTLNGGLPQGTPLSPMLTNLIMVPIDYEIDKALYNSTALQRQRYVYTRYADDIIISAKEKFDYDKVIEIINNILRDTPLKLNPDKTRFGSSAGRNWNLGVMCNKDNKITVGYRNKQKLKPIINNYIKDHKNNILWEEHDLQWLLGQLSWLNNVEPDYYTGFCEYLYNKHGIQIKDAIISDIRKHTI